MDSLAVATENMPRRQVCETPGRPEAEERMQADGLAWSGEVPDAAESVRDDENAPFGLPERDLLPESVPDNGDEPSARRRTAQLHPQVRNAEPRGDSDGVAFVAVEKLDDRLGLPQCINSLVDSRQVDRVENQYRTSDFDDM